MLIAAKNKSLGEFFCNFLPIEMILFQQLGLGEQGRVL